MHCKHSKGLKRVMAVFLCAVLMIVLTACGREAIQQGEPEQFNEKDEFAQEKENVEQYLREKYGKEFVATESEFYSASLGGKKSIITHAYLEDDSKIIVKVSRFTDSNTYKDDYLTKYWEKDAYNDIAPIIKQLYGEQTFYYADISMEFSKENWGRIPTFKEAILNAPTKVKFYFSQISFCTEEEELLDAEIEKVFGVIKYLKALNVKDYEIGFYYFDIAYKEVIKKYLEENALMDFILLSKDIKPDIRIDAKNKLRYELRIPSEDVMQINSKEDINKYLKKIRG